MDNFPPPLGDVPQLVSTPPFFDFAELVIIPVWHHSDRIQYMQQLSTESLHQQMQHIISTSPIHRISGAPRSPGTRLVSPAIEPHTFRGLGLRVCGLSITLRGLGPCLQRLLPSVGGQSADYWARACVVALGAPIS